MNVLIKDFYRTVFKNFTKFLSILLLSALGVMIFVGLKITSPIMQDSVFEKIKSQNLYDFKISSSFGLLKEDYDILNSLFEKYDIEYGYSINVIDDKDFDFRIENKPSDVGKIKIVSGRDLENSFEILLDKRLMKFYNINDVINFKNFKKGAIFDGEIRELKFGNFKVVGFIDSVEIGMKEYNESVESGYYCVILKEDFNFTNYSFAKLVSKELKNFDVNSKKYVDLKKVLKSELEEKLKKRPFEVYSLVYEQKRKKLDESKDTLSSKKNDLESFKEEIEKNLENLKNGKKDIRDAYSNLNYQKKLFLEEISKNKEKLESALSELNLQISKIDENLNSLKKSSNLVNDAYNDTQKNIKDTKTKIDNLNLDLITLNEKYLNSQIDFSKYNLEKTKIEKEILEKNNFLKALEENLDIKLKEKEEISLKILELEKVFSKMSLEKIDIEKNLKVILSEEIDAKLKFDLNYNEIYKKESEIKNGEEKVLNAKRKIEDNDKKIKEAEQKIIESDELISKILDPQYTITDGLVSSSSNSILKSAESMVGLSNIFSIFFFSISILVSLTSMTRMVDENRIQIGTLKALGYKSFTISKKYFYYGFLSSFLGGILGIFLGIKIIYPLVFNAYLNPFNFEKVDNFRYFPTLILGILIAVFTTSFSAYFSCNKTLREKISLLMRAKVLKGGEKIFIERFSKLWRELSFLFKVTIRNIFRYKIRLVMTVLGVTGCMALLVLGFGIKDSISGVSKNQFTKYTKYEIFLNFNPSDLDKNLEKFNEQIKEDKRIKDSYDLTFLNGQLNTKLNVETNVTIMTVDDFEKFKQFYTMYEKGKEIQNLEDGFYINEKISEKLKLKKGDEISFIQNNEKISYKIAGIFENHLGNYIVMNEKVHEKLFSKRQVKNSKLIRLYNFSEDEIQSVVKDLKEKDIVFKVSNITYSKKILENLLKSVDIIVIVMIVSSAFLSMVVLYNLSNINISERKREIATLKVLGFYPIEVSAYVYRETIILTFVGIIFGIFVGNILHKNILRNLATDSVKFFEIISLNSYLISAFLTLLFVFVIYFLVKIMLKKINMIESLKDVE